MYDSQEEIQMKKSLVALFLGIMVAFAPTSASAMRSISDRALKFLTGQAGMSDEAQSIVEQTKVYISAITNGRTSEVLQTHGDGGVADILGNTGVGFNADNISTILQSMTGTNTTDSQVSGLASSYGETSAESQKLTGVSNKYVNTVNPETGVEDLFITRYMTITEGRCPILSDMLIYNNQALNLGLSSTHVEGIVIGMPTFELHTTSMKYDVGLLNQPDASNSEKHYLQFYQGPTTQATLGGIIEVTTRE